MVSEHRTFERPQQGSQAAAGWSLQPSKRIWHKGVADFDALVALEPGNNWGHFNRGVLARLGDVDSALAALDRAVALPPPRKEVYFNRGSLCSTLASYPEAVADLDRALQIDPDYFEAIMNRGAARTNTEWGTGAPRCPRAAEVMSLPSIASGRSLDIGSAPQQDPAKAAAPVFRDYPRNQVRVQERLRNPVNWSPIAGRTARTGMLRVLVCAGAIIVTLAVLEGSASLVLLAYELYESRNVKLAETLHTQYDPELGWSNIPGTFIPDMYGPGKHVAINSQSLRSREDYPRRVPPGRIRVICSGDSFTFGYGVSNEATWCQQLSQLDARIEPLNLGLGGYGVDQAYLRYKRDGATFEHDIHIFAVISDSFERALHDTFLGYGKPTLGVSDGGLRARNVPVPRAPYAFRWVTNNVPILNRLRSVQLQRKVFPPRPAAPAEDEETRLFAAMFADLSRSTAANGGILVLVYLPTYNDLTTSWNLELRHWLEHLSTGKGWVYLDLAQELRSLPPDAIEGLFIPPQSGPGLVNAQGHYTEAGNRVVAEALYRRMAAIPEVAQVLSGARASWRGRSPD